MNACRRRDPAGRLATFAVAVVSSIALLPGAARAEVGASFGAPQPVDAANPLNALACSASGGLCIAADSSGRVTVSADGGADWSAPAALSGLTTAAGGVSCTPDGMCVVLSDREAYVLTGGVTGSWSSGTTLGTGVVVGLSCASEQLCVAIQANGEALVSTDPASASPSWNPTMTGAAALDSVSCPSTTLCVAGDGTGDVWYASDPASTPWSEIQRVDTVAGMGVPITALWCQASGLCVAGDENGDVLDSPDVTQGAGSWSAPDPTGASAPLESIACVSGGGGCVATSATATAAGPALAGPGLVGSGGWGVAYGAGSDLTQVACVSAQSCLGTDAIGDVVPGAVGPGAMTLSTRILSFGQIGVGARTPAQTVNVTDSGPGALNIGASTLTGAAGSSFTVDGDTCSGARLPPGGSCTLTVAFAPKATGALDAGLQIPSDDPAGPATVSLSATGSDSASSTHSISHSSRPSTAGRTRVTRAAVTATLVDVIVLCKGRSGQRCTTHLRLTAHERLRGHQVLGVSDARRIVPAARVTVRRITLGTAGVTLNADRGRVVHLSLGAAGRRLLIRLGRLRATLTVTQTVGRTTVGIRRFHLSFSTRRSR